MTLVAAVRLHLPTIHFYIVPSLCRSVTFQRDVTQPPGWRQSSEKPMAPAVTTPVEQRHRFILLLKETGNAGVQAALPSLAPGRPAFPLAPPALGTNPTWARPRNYWASLGQGVWHLGLPVAWWSGLLLGHFPCTNDSHPTESCSEGQGQPRPYPGLWRAEGAQWPAHLVPGHQHLSDRFLPPPSPPPQ